MEIVVHSSFSKSLLIGQHVLMSFIVNVVGLPSCLSCHYVPIVYPDSHRVAGLAWSFISARIQVWWWIILMEDCLLGICHLISPCGEFLSLFVRTFSIFSSKLYCHVSVVKVFLVWVKFFMDSSPDFIEAANSLPYEQIFSPASSIQHWHVIVARGAFDFGLCYIVVQWKLYRINKEIRLTLSNLTCYSVKWGGRIEEW